MTEKTILVTGSAYCGKTLILKKQAEYLRKQGKKVFVVGEDDKMNKRVTVDFDEESYYLDGEYWTSWDHYGEQMAEEINKLLDKQDKQIKELEKENENQSNILEDFMLMLNRLQANPDDEILQLMSKDMLRMMGKDIMGDFE